jgi:L-histidine N-alpha-methyltransferase
VEIGSGTSAKLRLLLDAMARRHLLRRCVLLDINARARVRAGAGRAVPRTSDAPGGRRLQAGFDGLGPGGGQLLCFLGSTISGFEPEEVPAFLRCASTARATRCCWAWTS